MLLTIASYLAELPLTFSAVSPPARLHAEEYEEYSPNVFTARSYNLEDSRLRVAIHTIDLRAQWQQCHERLPSPDAILDEFLVFRRCLLRSPRLAALGLHREGSRVWNLRFFLPQISHRIRVLRVGRLDQTEVQHLEYLLWWLQRTTMRSAGDAASPKGASRVPTHDSAPLTLEFLGGESLACFDDAASSGERGPQLSRQLRNFLQSCTTVVDLSTWGKEQCDASPFLHFSNLKGLFLPRGNTDRELPDGQHAFDFCLQQLALHGGSAPCSSFVQSLRLDSLSDLEIRGTSARADEDIVLEQQISRLAALQCLRLHGCHLLHDLGFLQTLLYPRNRESQLKAVDITHGPLVSIDALASPRHYGARVNRTLQRLQLSTPSQLNLSPLSCLRSLRCLELEGVLLSNLDCFSICTSIEVLTLHRSTITCDLAPMQGLEHLRELSLAHLQTRSEDTVWDWLRGCASLVSVHLQEVHVLEDLAALACLPFLKCVHLVSLPHLRCVPWVAPPDDSRATTPARDAVCTGAGACGLDTLVLKWCPLLRQSTTHNHISTPRICQPEYDDVAVHQNRLRALSCTSLHLDFLLEGNRRTIEKVSLYSCVVDQNHWLRTASRFHALHVVRLVGCTGIQDLEFLRCLPSLTKLAVATVRDACLDSLDGLRWLEHPHLLHSLELANVSPAADPRPLQLLSGLVFLRLCDWKSSTPLLLIAALSSMRSLRSLSLLSVPPLGNGEEFKSVLPRLGGAVGSFDQEV